MTELEEMAETKIREDIADEVKQKVKDQARYDDILKGDKNDI